MATRQEAQRAIEKIEIILSRSATQTCEDRDGTVHFDGYKVGLIDALHIANHIDKLKEYLNDSPQS
jgi:hypothetical protein